MFSAKIDARTLTSSRPLRWNLCTFSASLVLAAILLASCAGTKPSPSTAVIERDTGSATRAALKDMLDPTRAPPQVLAFYSRRDFQPAWTDTSDQQEAATDVRAVLAHAHDQGLRDSEYAVSRNGGSRGKDAAQFEIALTGAVLRYARDVRAGRLPPGSVFEDVELPAKTWQPVAQSFSAR